MPEVSKKARKSALKALREGRVAVRSIHWTSHDHADTALVVVTGYTGQHQVRLTTTGHWDCSCAKPGCGHVTAAKLVTGHQVLEQPPPVLDSTPAECRHGMQPAFCADCTGRDGGESEQRQRRAELLSRRGWTAAAFRGRCALCGEHYDAGDPIQAVPKPSGQVGTAWAGACCSEEAT